MIIKASDLSTEVSKVVGIFLRKQLYQVGGGKSRTLQCYRMPRPLPL